MISDPVNERYWLNCQTARTIRLGNVLHNSYCNSWRMSILVTFNRIFLKCYSSNSSTKYFLFLLIYVLGCIFNLLLKTSVQ